MSIRKFRAGRVSTITANQYVGQRGDVFYDESTGQFRVSNGTTPGGTVVATALNLANGTADIFVNNVTVNGTSTTINNIVSNNETTVTGVLTVTGNASFIGNTEFTGNTIFVGPIINTGPRTSLGDTTFVGNVTTTGNLITVGRLILTGPMDNIGDNTFLGNITAQGTNTFVGPSIFIGNVNEVGNLTVTGKAVNNGVSIFNGDMTVTGNTVQTGHATFIITTSATDSGIDITANSQGLSQTPVNSGVLLHVSGEENNPSRIYNDSSNNYAGFVGRRYNGNMLSPTQVLANQEVTRFAANPYTSGGWQTTGIGQLRWYASENQTATAQGGRAEFWVAPIGSNGTIKSVTIDSTGLTATGNVTADNIVVSGNIIGNLTTTTAGISNLNVSGNISYSASTNNATVTQLIDKSTTVTCNGRTGQITTNSSSIAKGAAVTFTVNNSYVTAATDVPVVVFQTGATANSYSVSVTHVQVGSFNITITNNGVGPLSDTIVINFAVIKVA